MTLLEPKDNFEDDLKERMEEKIEVHKNLFNSQEPLEEEQNIQAKIEEYRNKKRREELNETDLKNFA